MATKIERVMHNMSERIAAAEKRVAELEATIKEAIAEIGCGKDRRAANILRAVLVPPTR